MLNLFRQLPTHLQIGLAVSFVALAIFLIWSAIYLGFKVPAPQAAADPATTTATTRPAPRVPPPPPPTGPVSVAIGNGVNVINNGVLNVTVQNFGQVPVAHYRATDSSGGSADVEFVLLYGNAIWAFGSDSEFLSSTDTVANLSAFLSSPEFMRRASTYSDIICLGLASSASEPPIINTIQLSSDRAVRLCRLVQATVRVEGLRVSALGLGYNTVSAPKNSAEERRQRAVALVGVHRVNGNPDVETIVAQLLRAGAVDGFDFRTYQLAQRAGPLDFEAVERRQTR